MRDTINSKDLADRFGKSHKHTLISINKISEGDELTSLLFTETEYTSVQNKKLKSYDMGIEGFCILTDTWGFSRGGSAPIKAEILAEFGHSFVICGSDRTREEDYFYTMLKQFFKSDEVFREYPISGYFVDFYMPYYGLFIEHDGAYHFTKNQIEKDKKREEAIREYVRREMDDEIIFIRVESGKEIEGLSVIAGYIAGYPGGSEKLIKSFDDSKFNKVITESQPELIFNAS